MFRKQNQQRHRCLILGCGESGKSTFIKQMRIIHSAGFQTEEKLKIKEDIAKNIADSIKVLIDQAGGEVALSSNDSTKKAYHNVTKNLQIPTSGMLLLFLIWGYNLLISREIAGYLFSKFYNKKKQLLGMMFQLADDIQILWESQPIQEAYERRNEFQIVECAKYFLTKVHQVMHEDYVPTEDDIVNTRVKTVGKEKKYPYFKINS